MSCPVVRYAPIPAMIPSIASLPFNFSAIAFDCLSFIVLRFDRGRIVRDL